MTSNFHERKYYGWQNSKWGDKIVGSDPLEGQLVNSRGRDIFTHIHTRPFIAAVKLLTGILQGAYSCNQTCLDNDDS